MGEGAKEPGSCTGCTKPEGKFWLAQERNSLKKENKYDKLDKDIFISIF